MAERRRNMGIVGKYAQPNRLTTARLKSSAGLSSNFSALSVHAHTFGKLASYDGQRAQPKYVVLPDHQQEARRQQRKALPIYVEPSDCLFDACFVNTMPEPVAWPVTVPVQYGSKYNRSLDANAFARQYAYDRKAKAYVWLKPNQRKPKRIEPEFTDSAYLDRDVASVMRQTYSGQWVHNARAKLKCDPGTHDMRNGPMPYDARANERAMLASMVREYQTKLALSYFSYLTGGTAQ